MEGDVIDAASAVHAADGCTHSRGGAETFVLERISLQWGFRRKRTGKGEKIEPLRLQPRFIPITSRMGCTYEVGCL